tara:strand:- start:20 stop:253 length:234 start_codon:yes stop_codon:yes gene_type:complete
MKTKIEDIFIYDDTQSFKGNFYRWYAMNTKEKEIWGDKPYRVNDALEVYKSIWGDKQQKELGILEQLKLPLKYPTNN